MDNCFCNNDFELGKIIVSLNKNFTYSPSLSYHIFDDIDIEKVELIFHSNEVNNESNLGDVLLICLKNKDTAEVLHATSKLLTNPFVAYAEPDYLYDMDIIPNDPDFEYLWGMKKIHAPSAWNYTVGKHSTVVGVLDTGIDYTHPDIKNNMWISQNCQFVNGWNFVDDNNDPMDKNSHGTHVAGTIGAVGNNFIGVTGLCWCLQLAAFKIGESRIDLASAIKAIYFANMNNIPILNNSWGGPTYSPILKYVIERYCGLFVASAGNNASNNDLFPIYPASYDCDNIISVAATNKQDDLASFSNYGFKTVDIAAPGTEILSTSLNGEYSYKNGTSMSAPHVAGAVALLKSYMPFLTPLEIKKIILFSSNPVPNLFGKVLTGSILDVNSMIVLSNFIKRYLSTNNYCLFN